jgi:hypothetical protein
MKKCNDILTSSNYYFAYTGYIFEFFVMRPAQPITVSCVGLFSSAWYGNIALRQCMLCINRLEPVADLTENSLCKNIVMEYSHVQK